VLFFPALCFSSLTGIWNCDDGGTYYLRQIGNSVYWYGERSENKPAWSNVYKGEISNNKIKGMWADVPKGKTMSNGLLNLAIYENGHILKADHKTGGFGGSKWTKASVKEDCLPFHPASTTLKLINRRWKIVDGNHWLFDFGPKQDEAKAALRVIKHYGMNQSCFVGRPDSSFQYMLVSGKAPVGTLSGEDCVSFTPATTTAKNINGRWKIVDGNHWIFDFGNKEQEAKDSLQIIQKYGFTKSCYVGRPDPSFQYLRK
jgi:hypothetical protein